MNFAGYSHIHDFWVNADHPYLFYPGWCTHNARTLQIPKDYIGNFNWSEYIVYSSFRLAPKSNFVSTYKTDVSKTTNLLLCFYFTESLEMNFLKMVKIILNFCFNSIIKIIVIVIVK